MSRPAACAEEAAERLRAGRMSDTTPLGWIAQRLPLRRGGLPPFMRLGPPGGGASAFHAAGPSRWRSAAGPTDCCFLAARLEVARAMRGLLSAACLWGG